MLSQIEIGSARPSMDTRCYLAQRLGKSVVFFLEEAPEEQGELVQAGVRLEQARQAAREGRTLYAQELLAAEMPECLELVRRLELARLDPESSLPNLDELLLLKARQAYAAGDRRRAAALLEGMEAPGGADWALLRAQIFMAEGQFAKARALLEGLEPDCPEALPLLEQCCSALEDYKMAYFYACKQRKGL